MRKFVWRFLNQVISQRVEAIARYSASAEDIEIVSLNAKRPDYG